VSVIVPVRNRRELLIRLLDGLDNQSFRDFETVVVDDGSADGSDLEAAARVVAGRKVVLLRSGGSGAVAARCLGVKGSSGEILAFTDSDCVPDVEWLSEGVRAIDSGADLVNGRTVPERELGPFERSHASGEEGLYPTSNMFFRRSAYERFGGFDREAESLLGFRLNERARGTGFGEDTILAWRMIRAGAPHAYAPSARVVHHVFPPDLVETFSRVAQTAAFPALVREVPELRGTPLIKAGVFLGSRRRVPWYACALALAFGRPKVAAAAAGVWAARRARDLRRGPAPWPASLRWLPAEMAFDACMGTALVVGSVRARSVVL
jgi:cellulose synthase/poly-beta-1,6-N-acetylglucosamine synthase-like glycosyltransferase